MSMKNENVLVYWKPRKSSLTRSIFPSSLFTVCGAMEFYALRDLLLYMQMWERNELQIRQIWGLVKLKWL